ncbi:MAG: hypothetical protein E7183_01830 [Erysipelotrichaceae bacterium]|nr:hypothetical protein [Erysipelotrichaceae bacterium]
MVLRIIQGKQGFVFGGPKETILAIDIKNITYKIQIKQLFQREIIITSSINNDYKDLYSVYYSLESLLMLFDGQFYSVSHVFDESNEITESWIKRTLSSRSSADFMIGKYNKLIDFAEVLNANILLKWIGIEYDLDIVNNMIQYCLSSVKMPKDMQLAFMVESFIPICELVFHKNSWKLPSVKKGESKLKKFLLEMINRYGKTIFQKELQIGINIFSQKLVNSRNRISHIKTKSKKDYIKGKENVYYLMKLSLLYRVILFEILGIEKNKYELKLDSIIQTIEQRFTKKFIS